MSYLEIIIIAIGLAMDAFAVSICKGLKMKKIKYGQALVIALFFGGFQALMPLLGWLLGHQFESFITEIDHYIAFALLAIIGGKMIFDSVRKKKDDKEEKESEKFDIKELFILAIATSIDALAVGITFAFLKVEILGAISIIGVITLVICFLGVLIGGFFGDKLQGKAEIVGGIILILMGLKILLEHLGWLPF